MIDIFTRGAIAVVYLVVAVCAYRTIRSNHMLVGRRISTLVIMWVALLWSAMWFYFLASIPSSWPHDSPVAVQAWVSRAVHIPQIGGMILQMYMIRKSEDPR